MTVRLRFDGPTLELPRGITHAELRVDGGDSCIRREAGAHRGERSHLPQPARSGGVVLWCGVEDMKSESLARCPG